MQLNNAKYDDFDEYYNSVCSRLSVSKRLFNETDLEARELIYFMFYKDIRDVTAINIINEFYRLYKNKLK